MNVQNSRMPIRAEHRRHDRLLVTRYAMDDAYPSERDDARQLIDSCPECAALAADIQNIAGATSRLPDPLRTRDFTITAEQADKLRGPRLARWMRGLSAPGWGAVRPIAGAALSIGIVMAVVGLATPPATPAGETSTDNRAPVAALASPTAKSVAPAPQAGGASATQAPEQLVPAPLATIESSVANPMAPASALADGSDQPPMEALGNGKATENPDSAELNNAYAQATQEPGFSAQGSDTAAIRTTDSTRDWLLYGGLAIALISSLLLGLAWFARRHFADPLLR